MEENLFRIVNPDGTYDERLEPEMKKEELLSLYSSMLRVRMLDDRMLVLQRQGRIGFYVPSSGEEAVQVGSAWSLEKNDWVFPAYREPGAALVKGFPLKNLIAQSFGNILDPNKGRQMPSHAGYKDANYVTPSSPVGTQIPHAVGAAWAMKLKKEKNVALVYFGEGATSGNDFHAAMNFAGVFKVPCIFICKNNQWAISLPFTQQTAAPSISIKALAYGFEGARVDGNDVLAVLVATRHAVEKARFGGGPALIEAVTYRMGPHSSSDDPTRYRDAKEVEEWRRRDPIARFGLYLRAKNILDDKADNKIKDEIEAEISNAVKEVETEPKPDVETIFTDVYAEMPANLKEQMEELLAQMGKRKTEVSEDFPL